MDGRSSDRPSAVPHLKLKRLLPKLGAMSLDTALVRIAEIRSALTPPAPPTDAASGQTFASILQGASGPAAQVSGAAPVGGPGGASALNAARGEVGVAEQPPGSNDGPRISEYRRAVPGGPVGPWCAYFVSWCARQAGTPLGEQGQGYASVSQVWSWAQRTGRAVPNGPGVRPQPGDLIVWGGRHIGIVEGVLPDGRVQTIEGNSSDRVSRRVHPPGGATGYVRLG